ncbi:flagellin [Pleomorphomonas sp. JP5]|uniref:flagellin n=1 Tax=Pleomorphomonas sp. JP5 TaxID=2942998 RepID=UPI00204473CB|nr:flagellin [Pleomorphomonas sp. JP5]MCM5559495.1 flagellin [Pleomorphomonas sp. JP5]
MVDISLTKSLRSTVATLNWVSEESAAANQRLTSGIKIQSALDDPSTYISAKSLSLHAAALDKYLERLDQGLGVINAADNGLSSISESINTLKGVVTRAAASKNAFERADLVKEYNDILDKIVDTAKDSSYSGKNLLLGDGNDLTLYLSTDQNESVTIEAVDFTDLLNSLGLKKLDEGKLATYETKLTDGGAPAKPLKSTSKLVESPDYAVGDEIAVKDASGTIISTLKITADTTAGDLVTAFSLPDKGLRATLGSDGVLNVEAANKMTVDTTRAADTIASAGSPPSATSAPLMIGATPAVGTDLLTATGQYKEGDVISIRQGNTVVGALTVGAGTTVDDLVSAFNVPASGLSATLDAAGVITVDSASAAFAIDKTSTTIDLTTATASTWVKRTDAEDAQQTVTDARHAAEKHATNIGIGLTLLKSRAEYIGGFSDILGATAESMRASDKNEEAAIMLALDTQQQLAISSFSITQTADDGILRLLGSKLS